MWELTSTMPETGDDANPSPEQATPRASTGPVSTTETRLIDTKGLLQVSPYFGVRASFLGKGWSACEEYNKNRATLGNTSECQDCQPGIRSLLTRLTSCWPHCAKTKRLAMSVLRRTDMGIRRGRPSCGQEWCGTLRLRPAHHSSAVE